MSVPKLTPEERIKALEKAQRMRSERTALRKELKAGKTSLSKVLDDAENEVIGKMRVKYLLESLPQVGKVTAEKIMTEIGIDKSRRVQGLGKRQIEKLKEKLY